MSRAGVDGVENLGGWLTTVVARVALNMLRSRSSRAEQSLEFYVSDPVVDDLHAGPDPEHEALLADSVGLALLIVLETLSPPERLAFVLHDTFGVPFEEIAAILERSPEAARQLASRARRRVRGAVPDPDAGLSAQWEVVEAFHAAARDGNFEALMAVLDPEVELRADGGALSRQVQGAREVASQAVMWSRSGLVERRVLINGAPGVVSLRDGRPFSIVAVTVRRGRIARLDILADPERIARLDLSAV